MHQSSFLWVISIRPMRRLFTLDNISARLSSYSSSPSSSSSVSESYIMPFCIRSCSALLISAPSYEKNSSFKS